MCAAWIVPVCILYGISLSARPVFEHTHPPRGVRVRTRNGIAACTHGVFFGRKAPSPSHPLAVRAVLWAAWWAEFLVWYWPLQAVFCPHPAQAHDFHHRHPDRPLDPDQLSARRDEIAGGTPGWPPYTEIWGLVAAIDECFNALSQAVPAETPADDPRPHLGGRESSATPERAER